MNFRRTHHTATVIVAGRNSGQILIAGGDSTSDFHPLATTELFDPVTNRFVPGPTMQTARECHTATVLKAGANAGKILIAGGSSDSEGLASTELYDPQRNAFAPGPSMNYALRPHRHRHRVGTERRAHPDYRPERLRFDHSERPLRCGNQHVCPRSKLTSLAWRLRWHVRDPVAAPPTASHPPLITPVNIRLVIRSQARFHLEPDLDWR